jgi:excisionase family DNA binding protein
VAAIPAGTAGKYLSIDPSEKRLVGLDAGADMLGLSRAKFHQMVQAGDFDMVRIGRRVLVTVASIDAYIARKRAEQS